VEISYLADRPEFAPRLAAGLLEQWHKITPGLTLADRIEKLEAHLNRKELPIAWVAHAEGQPVGTAALRVHDLEGREDLTPWLGGVWVVPAHRNKGLGSALCAVVEEKTRAMGYNELFLFTLDRQTWYAALGWSSGEPAHWRGYRGTIMRKRLGD
jgi:predicted N-acetyltransferase YhbS